MTELIKEITKFSTLGVVHNHLYEIELNLHVNEISFSYERMGSKTHFEKEAKGYVLTITSVAITAALILRSISFKAVTVKDSS